MANIYRFNIMGLNVQPYNMGRANLVSGIVWQYCASNGAGVWGATNGICQIKYDPNSGIWIPYEDITESIAMNWLMDGLGQAFVDFLPVAMQGLLDQNQDIINLQIDRPRVCCMTPPWSPNNVNG